MFQQFFLLEGLSVLDNVADGLLYRGGRAAERQALAEAAIERVGREAPGSVASARWTATWRQWRSRVGCRLRVEHAEG